MASKGTTGSKPNKKGKGTVRKSTMQSKQVLHKRWLCEHGQEYRERLLRSIKEQLPKLDKLLREAGMTFD